MPTKTTRCADSCGPVMRSVVVIERRVKVGEQIGRESQDHDRQSDLRSDRELMGRP